MQYSPIPIVEKKKTKQILTINNPRGREIFFILNQPPFTTVFVLTTKKKEKRRGFVFHPLAPPHPLPDGKTFLKVDRCQRELHSIDSGRWFEFVPD